MLFKVISGGQTGADQAGLEAAQKLGIETGGYLPKGCRTEHGPNPELLTRFGMTEHYLKDYPPRTACNVRDSDLTLRLAVDFNSRGEVLTHKMCLYYNKPFLDVDMNPEKKPTPEWVASQIAEYKPKVINIAGNSKSTAGSSFQEECANFLEKVFEILIRLDP